MLKIRISFSCCCLLHVKLFSECTFIVDNDNSCTVTQIKILITLRTKYDIILLIYYLQVNQTLMQNCLFLFQFNKTEAYNYNKRTITECDRLIITAQAYAINVVTTIHCIDEYRYLFQIRNVNIRASLMDWLLARPLYTYSQLSGNQLDNRGAKRPIETATFDRDLIGDQRGGQHNTKYRHLFDELSGIMGCCWATGVCGATMLQPITTGRATDVTMGLDGGNQLTLFYRFFEC